MTRIRTFTGKMFDLDNPKAKDVDPVDIAHSLSLLCRYTGHVPSHYSVAQHSIYVSCLAPPELRKVGLLHDATEAYVGDMSRPLKGMLPEYKEVEDRVWLSIAERFNFDPLLIHRVKEADMTVFHWEMRDLWGVPAPDGYNLPTEKVVPLSADLAEQVFLGSLG